MKHFLFVVLACVACSKDPKGQGTAPVASSSAALAMAASAASATPATQGGGGGTAAGSEIDGMNCRAYVGKTTFNLHFRFTLMRGTLLVDGPETRRILTKATATGGTYVLQFVSYESEDRKPAAEKLTPQSIVARIVGNGDHDDLYFDGDVHPIGTSPSVPLRCE